MNVSHRVSCVPGTDHGTVFTVVSSDNGED